MSIVAQELALYRKAINDIDDRIEYRDFDKEAIYEIVDRLAHEIGKLYGEPRYTVTDAGRAELKGGE